MNELHTKAKKSGKTDKKRLILHSAVKVFSEKGYHHCRISDIAAEAGVAYGLVYHYFKNKEEILNCIFDENWGLLAKVIDMVDTQTPRLEEKLYLITSLILDAYHLAPGIIQVMVMEIARSSKFLKEPKIEAFEKAFSRLAEILSQHQAAGEIKSKLPPKVMAYAYFGVIELIITGYLLGTLKAEEGEGHEALKSSLVRMFLNGVRGAP